MQQNVPFRHTTVMEMIFNWKCMYSKKRKEKKTKCHTLNGLDTIQRTAILPWHSGWQSIQIRPAYYKKNLFFFFCFFSSGCLVDGLRCPSRTKNRKRSTSHDSMDGQRHPRSIIPLSQSHQQGVVCFLTFASGNGPKRNGVGTTPQIIPISNRTCKHCIKNASLFRQNRNVCQWINYNVCF